MIRILMIFALYNFGCAGDTTDLIDSKGLQKVEVQYVYLRTTTPTAISCNVFADSFEDISSKTFTDEFQWKPLITEINRIIEKGEIFAEGPDVRMTVKLYYKKKVMSICIGNTVMLMNGKNFINDDLFRDFINRNFTE